LRVISLINGSLISETSSIYALHYAKSLDLRVDLIHINGKDSLTAVYKSVEDLKDIAQKLDVEVNFVIFDDLDALKNFIESKEIDMVFCSTRHRHSILDKSFVQTFIHKKIKVDLSVIKVVKLGRANSIDNIILPIRDTKLSVKKFTLFATFSKAYNSKAEIYSVDKIAPLHLHQENQKERLQEIIMNLRHYFRLAKMMNFKFSIKHDFALSEGEKVKTHIAKYNYGLVVVGNHYSKTFTKRHPIDILFENPMINTLYFIPYEDNE